MGDEEDEGDENDDVVVEQGGGDHEIQPTDDLQQLRQRKDELTRKHLDQQRRKQQLKVFHSFSVSLSVLILLLIFEKNDFIFIRFG